LKALLINRIGDFFLLIGICLIVKFFHITHLDLLSALLPYFSLATTLLIFNFSVATLPLIGFCLMIAVVSKSAQLGLHT